MARPLPSIEDAFWQRVEIAPNDECWEWTGSVNVYGYGQYRYQARNLLAHQMILDLCRISYAGKVAHHVCHSRTCVNPDHLEILEASEHSRVHQGDFCKRGHPKSEVYVTPSGERSHCRICQRDRDRLARERIGDSNRM